MKKNSRKQNLPLVSVFLPTYNHEKFLPECLESIFAQDYTNLEVVCGDDCSTDNTANIMRQYAKKYSKKFLPIYHKTNLGFVGNFNTILAKCTGKYIVFFSGDDVMLPGKITKLVEFMEANAGHAMCYHDLEVFDSKTNSTVCRYSDIARPPGSQVESMLIPGTIVIGPAIIIRSTAIPTGGFNHSLRVLADWMFMIEVAATGKIGYIDMVLSRYRRHYGNISNKKDHYSEYFIGIAILRSKYPQLTQALTKYEGFIFACFMANSFRSEQLDLAFSYAVESLIRGYKPLLLFPLWLASKFRYGLLKRPIDCIISKIFGWLDAYHKDKTLDYKIYQEVK